MNNSKFMAILTAGFIATSASMTASASDERTEGGNDSWMTRQFASADTYNNSLNNSPRGMTGNPEQADRNIALKAGKKFANVTQGETVKFTSGDKSFTWKFDTLGTPNFQLADIAPTDFETNNVRIYVGENMFNSGS